MSKFEKIHLIGKEIHLKCFALSVNNTLFCVSFYAIFCARLKILIKSNCNFAKNLGQNKHQLKNSSNRPKKPHA